MASRRPVSTLRVLVSLVESKSRLFTCILSVILLRLFFAFWLELWFSLCVAIMSKDVFMNLLVLSNFGGAKLSTSSCRLFSSSSLFDTFEMYMALRMN